MSITFDVDDVPPATTGFPLASFASVLTRALEHELHACHVGTSTMLACAGPEAVVDRSAFANPLVNAVHLAFATHYPLRLTPDAIWTTIAQGFGLHIRLNAEALRGQFVDHQGKKELPVGYSKCRRPKKSGPGWSATGKTEFIRPELDGVQQRPIRLE